MSIEKVKFALSTLESKAQDEASKNAVKILAEYLDEQKSVDLDAFIEESEGTISDLCGRVRGAILEASDEDLYSLRGLVEMIGDEATELSELIDDREEDLLEVSEEDEEYLEEEEEEPEYSSYGDDDDDFEDDNFDNDDDFN